MEMISISSRRKQRPRPRWDGYLAIVRRRLPSASCRLILHANTNANAMQRKLRQSRAKQSKAEQSRAKQSKAEQSRAKQSKAEQSKDYLVHSCVSEPDCAMRVRHFERLSLRRIFEVRARCTKKMSMSFHQPLLYDPLRGLVGRRLGVLELRVESISSFASFTEPAKSSSYVLTVLIVLIVFTVLRLATSVCALLARYSVELS